MNFGFSCVKMYHRRSWSAYHDSYKDSYIRRAYTSNQYSSRSLSVTVVNRSTSLYNGCNYYGSTFSAYWSISKQRCERIR